MVLNLACMRNSPDRSIKKFELADIDPVGITPVWQREVKINPRKVMRSMRQTANKSEAEMQRDNEAADDVLDEINRKAKAAKAYLKRQGQR